MALEKFNWQNGTQIEPAKVEIGGQSYNVSDAQYEGETPLSASNLNLMQDTILGNVKDNLDDDTKIPSVKAVKDVYSTNETKTNKVWIDNKPIYRKIINLGNLSSNTGIISFAHGITNIDTFTKIDGMVNNGQEWFPFNSVYRAPNVSMDYDLGLLANKTNIVYTTKTNRSAYQGWVLLEYTKTD